MAESLNHLGPWIDRISALHRNLLRKLAAKEDLQFVHIETLQYLAFCNHYSNTAQAISDYLGQTKGSISQSLALMDERGLIQRVQNIADKRIFHIHLTPAGKAVAKKANEIMDVLGHQPIDASLKNVLSALQAKNGMKGFGICTHCKFNIKLPKNKFICGLTQEELSSKETELICREYEAS